LAGERCIHASAVHVANDALAGLGIFDHRILVKEAGGIPRDRAR
jgi:hypothetical protein